MNRSGQVKETALRYQLPTVRTRFVHQLMVMLAAGRHLGVFTSQQLEVPGVSNHRKGLVTGFLHSCGLLVRGGGRGIYRATPAARRIAEAWGRSETLGRRELAIVLERSWFADIARQELGQDGGQQVALVNRLLTAARAPETRRGEVEVLILWLLEARLLLPVREGYVSWNADAVAPVSAEAEQSAVAEELEEDLAGTNEGSQGVGDALIDEFPGAPPQLAPESASAKDSARVDGDSQEAATDPAVDSILSPDPDDPHDRPNIDSSFEGPSPKLLPDTPYTTVIRAGTSEDEMLNSEHAPDAQPTPDDGSPLRSDAIPTQTARNVGVQSPQPTSRLTTLVELVGRPIELHELVQLSEEELLYMYRLLRRFVDVAAGARDSEIKS